MCFKCNNSTDGERLLGFEDRCVRRTSCPEGTYLYENEDEYYCKPCGANCDFCIDDSECTHCAIAPTRYSLHEGNCVISAVPAGHFVEYYDEEYS
jgi:hypothetical protein